jgi:ATP-dependent DNA helicase RecQ
MASATMIASPVGAPDHLGRALKRYWGYDAFRPKQEEIVRNLAAGRDVCVVMPTGGGKSLCYQLPAVLQENRTAVVISPLIALMQDQVAQLRQMGVSAVFLNSSVAEAERSAIKKQALAGEFRLMYISPERAVMDGTADWLRNVPVSFFAIDEAHCISEWGHDFRPEYRQLSKLRELFPERPIAAFTASATQRVRHDIVEQLKLRDPFRAVLSFRRENLRYLVKFCRGDMQDKLLLKAVKEASRGNVIVYCPTVARVGEVVDLLGEHGIAAVEYHGQMDSQARRENQEKWMTEEVRILVGTIAFGLGINKPNVRAVIRLGLPDSIEQLYQETGRAGRDGLPADCYLFWEWKDKRLREYFMSKIGSSREYKAAQKRFAQIESFCKSSQCRQKQICSYFGEERAWKGCGICDCCAGAPAWLDDSDVALEKEKGGASRSERKGRGRSGAARRAQAATFEWHVSVSVDEELREFLKEWRKNIARERNRAAFIVMHDTTLEQICVVRPKTLAELRKLSGIGEAKCEEYGQEILDALRRFEAGERTSQEWHARATDASQETLELLKKGHTFTEIAQLRGRKVATVVALIANLVEKGELPFDPAWVGAERFTLIQKAAAKRGLDLLGPLKKDLPAEITFEEIRLVVAHLRHEKKLSTGA